MADITDPRVITWANETVRTNAESWRNLHATLTDMKAQYDAEIDPILDGHNPNDVLIDGRAADGVSILDKGDMTGFMTQVSSMLASLNGVGVLNVIRKPCVRQLDT